jgi:hypothetical protein
MILKWIEDRMAERGLDLYDSTGITGEKWIEFWIE